MLLKDGDKYLTSPADLLCILHDVPRNTFHVAFFEESPMPGPVKNLSDLEVLRLKSKLHHNIGSPTLEGALEQMKEMRQKIDVLDSCVLEEPLDWNGQIPITFLAVNWVREDRRVQMKDLVR